MKNLVLAGIVVLLLGCGSRENSTGLTTVKVLEVEQVANYTYLLVKAKGPEYWVAVPTMEARVGDTYQYQGGMLMENFHSKELDQTFDKVIFLEALFMSSDPATGTQTGQAAMPPGHPSVQEATPGSTVQAERAEVKVEASAGSIPIADLFANPESYQGKTIRVRGEVTKFNAAIMERNWVHLQDGTEHQGKFDLTATSVENFSLGSVVTLEGVLAVNRDFGYGYSYEILLEQAKRVE